MPIARTNWVIASHTLYQLFNSARGDGWYILNWLLCCKHL